MKITITKHHVLTAQESEGQYNPVELAILNQDCFEEVRFSEDFRNINLDGEVMVLPRRVQSALQSFAELGTMRPLSFDLEIEEPVMLVDEHFFMDEVEEVYDLDLDYNYL